MAVGNRILIFIKVYIQSLTLIFRLVDLTFKVLEFELSKWIVTYCATGSDNLNLMRFYISVFAYSLVEQEALMLTHSIIWYDPYSISKWFLIYLTLLFLKRKRIRWRLLISSTKRKFLTRQVSLHWRIKNTIHPRLNSTKRWKSQKLRYNHLLQQRIRSRLLRERCPINRISTNQRKKTYPRKYIR